MQLIYRPPIEQTPVTESVPRPVSERIGNWVPVVTAAALPTVFLPNVVDAYILPRASIVITAACLGTGLALLVPNRPGLGALRWPLVAAAAAAILAFAFSVSWPLSLIGGYTRYESLPMRLAYLGLLAVPVWLLRTTAARTLVLVALVAGTTLASIWAITQLNAPFRPDGNLGNANLLGVLIAMAAALCLAQLRRWRWSTAIAVVCLAVMAEGLIASQSRGGGLALLAGGAALVAFSLRGRAAALAAGVGAVLVVAGLLFILLGPLRGLNGDPGPTRVHLYQDAVHMVAARPLTGWGEEATGLVFGRFLSGDWSPGVTFDRAHSGLLDLGATQGLLGLGTTGWVLAVLFGGLWRRRFENLELNARGRRLVSLPVGCVGAALVAYTVWVAFNFDWAPATGVFWLLAGTAWSAVRASESAAQPAPANPAWSGRQTAPRLAGAVALVAVAAILGALPVVAEAWYTNGRPDLAVEVDPLQAQYRRALGEALVQQGRQTEGLDQLRLAASLGATDPGLYVELGDEELQAGNVDQARADYQRALVIDPFWAPARQRLYGKGGLGSA